MIKKPPFFDLLEVTNQTLIFEYCVNLLFIKKRRITA